MELIFAIIIFFFLFLSRTSRKLGDAVRKNESNKRMATWEEVVSEFKSKYCDQYIDDAARMMGYTRRVMDPVTDEEDRRTRTEFKKRFGYAPSFAQQYLSILANYGKIPIKYVDRGISIPYYRTECSRDVAALKKKGLEFLKWYEEKLREHGVDEKIVLVPQEGTLSYDKGKCMYLSDIDPDNIPFGVYHWDSLVKASFCISSGERLSIDVGNDLFDKYSD